MRELFKRLPVLVGIGAFLLLLGVAPGALYAQDSDGDGVPNASDKCPNQANICTNLQCNNGGGACPSGTSAECADADADADGIGDTCDNCPTSANADQANADGDNRGDACDNCPDVSDNATANTDTDSDGVFNACDNCPVDANTSQLDKDENGVGNTCQCVDQAGTFDLATCHAFESSGFIAILSANDDGNKYTQRYSRKTSQIGTKIAKARGQYLGGRQGTAKRKLEGPILTGILKLEASVDKDASKARLDDAVKAALLAELSQLEADVRGILDRQF